MSNRSLLLMGWLLFVGSAMSYIIASWGDFWGMLGSILFLVACLFFLIVHFRTR